MKHVRIIALLLIVGGLLLLAVPALAQDVPPPLNRDELPTWEDFILNAAAVFATLGILFGPLSEILVSVVKVVLSKVRPTALKYTGVIAFLLPLVIAALYWTVDAFGFGDAFVRAGNFLLAIAPVILGFFGIQVFQTLTYRGMKRIGASVTGEDKAALKAKG